MLKELSATYLGGRRERQGLVEIGAHQAFDRVGLLLESSQRIFNGLNQGLEGGEVAVMRAGAFHVAPEVLNRIVVGRVGRQWHDLQAVSVCGDKGAGRFGRVIAGAILNDDQRLLGGRQDGGQEGAVGLGREAFGLTVPEQAPAEGVNQAKDLVACALVKAWPIVSRSAVAAAPTQTSSHVIETLGRVL